MAFIRTEANGDVCEGLLSIGPITKILASFKFQGQRQPPKGFSTSSPTPVPALHPPQSSQQARSKTQIQAYN